MDYTADELFEHLDLKSGINVLDVGCGTGIALLKLRNKMNENGNFHGIDISKGMIEQAQKKAESYDNCLFKVGDAENIEYPKETFDLVISNMVIQYLPDQNKGLAEMNRVLKPGGKLALSYEGEYYGKPMFEAFKTVAERMGFKKAADTWRWIISNHKPVDVFYNMIENAGFNDVKIKAIYYLNHDYDFERMIETSRMLLKNYGYFREGMSDTELEEYKKELIKEAKKSELFNTYYNQFCLAYATKS
jgi:ubiquinone/menaquinone biosynthesis C-methylase UbiE